MPPFRSWAEREVADAAIALGAKVVTRRLPRRFLTRPTLVRAAKAARPDLAPLEEELDFAAPPGLPEEAPDWDEPERAIAPPDVFVDVLEVRR